MLLGGCTYEAGNLDRPIMRRSSWFSYAGADDIRDACQPGEPDRYRLIYNADYEEQVRAYDLMQSATGQGAMLFVRVFGGGGNILSFNPFDPTGPWRGARSEAALSEDDFRQLKLAIDDSGFWDPAPRGLLLRSDQFYWLAAACVDGRFHFNAWRHPSDRFARLRLLPALLPFDQTGVPVREPRQVLASPPRGSGDTVESTFTFRVGENGLAGRLTLF